MIRPMLAIIGLPPLVIFAGLVYSSAFIRSSHYGSYFLFCIVYGVSCYFLFLLSRCVRSSAIFWVPVLIVAWIGPFVIGHYYGYANTKYIVWRMVQNNTDKTFAASWKNLDRDKVFDLYVESTTGNSFGGFFGYLSLMAHEGWSGFEPAADIGSIYIERRGIWVWVTWGMHLVFLLVATAMAMGATIPDKSQGQHHFLPAKKPDAIPDVPESQAKQRHQDNGSRDPTKIRTIVKPDSEKDKDGWWLIRVSFRGGETTFRAYYPEKKPTGRVFFQDIHHALYRLKSEGLLNALAVLGSVEGGLTAKEALEQLMDDEKKIRRMLGKYYYLFENDDKFFQVFFPEDIGG